MTGSTHLGYYKPDNLPHLDAEGLLQFITFAQADAAPRAQKPRTISHKRQDGDIEFLNIDNSLDRSPGSCLLRRESLAMCVHNAILAGAGVEHQPIAWVVMPNHVHILTVQISDQKLGKIVRRIKSGAATCINRQLGKSGKFWQVGYFDRYMRSIEHIERTIDYIHQNPVKAGLVANAGDWQFSSFKDFSVEKAMATIESAGWKTKLQKQPML